MANRVYDVLRKEIPKSDFETARKVALKQAVSARIIGGCCLLVLPDDGPGLTDQ